MSNIETLLEALINEEDVSEFNCKSRIEHYLKKCCCGETCDDMTPKTRVEYLLGELSKKIAGGGSSGDLLDEIFTYNPYFIIPFLREYNNNSFSKYGEIKTTGNTTLTDEILEKFAPLVKKYFPYRSTGQSYWLFYICNKITKIPKDMLDWSKITSGYYLFYKCTNLKEFIGNMRVDDGRSMFYDCSNIETIEALDLKDIGSSYCSGMFSYCMKLKNLTLYNVTQDLQIGAGTGWGSLLTVDSLINTCKECIKPSSSRTLTVGSANLEKLANVYVKFTDTTQTTIATGEKGDVVVCESTDEGAMTITEYMNLKNWQLA